MEVEKDLLKDAIYQNNVQKIFKILDGYQNNRIGQNGLSQSLILFSGLHFQVFHIQLFVVIISFWIKANFSWRICKSYSLQEKI